MLSVKLFSRMPGFGNFADAFENSVREIDAIIEKIGVVTYKHTKFIIGSGLMTFSRKGKVDREHLEEYLKTKYNIDADFKSGLSAFFSNKGNVFAKEGRSLTFCQVLDMVG